MRTKYFEDITSFSISYWRLKNGKMEYFNKSEGVWYPSARKITGNCHDGPGHNSNWRQITRDEARKKDPRAFR